MPPRRRPSAPSTPLLDVGPGTDDMPAFKSSATDFSSTASSTQRNAFTSLAASSPAPDRPPASATSDAAGGGARRPGFVYRSKSATGEHLVRLRDRVQMLYNGRREARTRFVTLAGLVVLFTWFLLGRMCVLAPPHLVVFPSSTRAVVDGGAVS